MTHFTQAPRRVYFLRPVGGVGPIKIGCSLHPEERRRAISLQTGIPLEIVAESPGCLDDERTIHSLFWHHHLHGEWFVWSPYLQLVIDAARRGELAMEALPEAKVRPMPWKRRAHRVSGPPQGAAA